MTDPTASVAAFAEVILRRRLWSHQIAAVESDRFMVAIAGGRRSGKTLAAQVKALHVAATTANARVLVVSPAIENSRNFLRDLGDLIAVSKIRGSVVDEQVQLVTFTNGAEVRCVAATPAQIRGRGKDLRLVIVDEAAFVDGDVWRSLYYTLFDLRSQGSQAFLVCSPWGKPEHFFRATFNRGMDGDPDVASFRWSMLDNPTLSKAFVDRERERIAPSEAAAEIDGQWSDAAGSLFTRELLAANTAPFEVSDLAALKGPARCVVGCDWGVSFDQSACVALYRLPVAALNTEADPRPHFIALPFSWAPKTPLSTVVDDLIPVAANFRFIASEVNGVGAGPTQELFRRTRRTHPRLRFVWAPVSTTSATKTTGYSALLNLFERRRLVLPNHPGLQRQLAGLRFSQGERGFVSIGAEDAATHDDVCDALMLCALPYRPQGAKRVVSRLASLADPRRAVADARLPELDCPVVTTGDGLRLHQRPALQGVDDGALSLYAPAASPKPVGQQLGRFFLNTTKELT